MHRPSGEGVPRLWGSGKEIVSLEQREERGTETAHRRPLQRLWHLLGLTWSTIAGSEQKDKTEVRFFKGTFCVLRYSQALWTKNKSRKTNWSLLQ